MKTLGTDTHRGAVVVMAHKDDAVIENYVERKAKTGPKFKAKTLWFNATFYALLHLSFLYGIYLAFTLVLWKTCLFACIYSSLGNLGITAGCHRLWSHRAYKAHWPLRAFLSILSSIAAQNSIFVWCRDHRVHHKFTETNADPHNIKEGFFFAHIGWLMRKKHPDVSEKGKTVEIDDLWADPIVRFQSRFFLPMVVFWSATVPAVIPWYVWNETIWNSFYIAVLTRYCLSLNIIWLVNSAAHKFGDQPYDKYIHARENPVVSLLSLGEGWHNYHHVFPWDYSASELGYTFNSTKLFIDFMAWIGLAYDLKTASVKMVRSRMAKNGDGTRVGRCHEEAKDACSKNSDGEEFQPF